MLSRRSLLALVVLAAVAACAPVQKHPSAVTPALEITLDLPLSPAGARNQLVTAFGNNGLPVATSQPGVVEFQAPREKGMLGYYEVFARAVIVPLDCGTRVTLFGEETHYPNASARTGTAVRIGPSSRGRALEVWTRLQTVAAALRGNNAVTSGASAH
ncbi:MAG TPA: hypothetical protein VJN70_14970 [Gemmatimonadaceae bacterium]|nr:hypothetical protein [Gemmatimonadaceae bacterium]